MKPFKEEIDHCMSLVNAIAQQEDYTAKQKKAALKEINDHIGDRLGGLETDA